VSASNGLRVAVYVDDDYRPEGGEIYADRAVLLFLAGVADLSERMVLAGQLKPDHPRGYYRVPESIEFAPLPTYPNRVDPRAIPAMRRSLGSVWRALDDVDVAWLLGPHPLCLAFALVAVLRRKRVALGVRQDFPAYARSRHPGRRLVHLAADVLEGSYRLLARFCPTVVVGPELARKYRHAPRLLQISVSTVREDSLADASAARREWDGEVQLLSVGRIDTEKNSLMLADVVERLGEGWRLTVCGEGPLEGELRERLEALGVADRVELRGYLPVDDGLMDLYRQSSAFLHVSLTEGLPQVLLEAFAAGIPIVATAVGGVAEAVGDAALLIPPGDPEAAAAALRRLAEDPELRARLVERGLERIRERTLEAESRRVASFLAGAGVPGTPSSRTIC